jgi:hypothetical protein
VQVFHEVGCSPEIAVGAVDAEQFWQLRVARKCATLEPDHYTLGDEVDDRAGLANRATKQWRDSTAVAAAALQQLVSPPAIR